MNEYIWYKNGRVFKKTADPEGKYPTEAINGNLSKMFKYFPNYKLHNESYHKNGERHRGNDKPAFVGYQRDGTPYVEAYYQNGYRHRGDDKPAYVVWHGGGSLCVEIYYKGGKRHRDNGKPAYIIYDKDGSIRDETYYRDGIPYH